MTVVRAATLVDPQTMELREYERPDLADGWGWLRVEACGVCGTDLELYEGSFTGSTWPTGPLIPGHEVVGVVEALPEVTARRWNVSVGDRVALEPNIPCGTCATCLRGDYPSCATAPFRPLAYGFVPVAESPGLWGGYADAMALHPQSVVHRVPPELDTTAASIFNALATGYEWAVDIPNLRLGQSVLVLGAGQRGLAAVAAATAAGADLVVCSGVGRDRWRLDQARSLGADLTVDVDEDDLVSAVLDVTRGTGIDVVVDASAGATEPIGQAIASVRSGGTVVLGGLNEGRRAELDVDAVVLRAITIMGARSARWPAYEAAIRHLVTDPSLARLSTHVVPIDRAEDAVAALATDDEVRCYVSVVPGDG